jgi:hypothetical protein
MEEPRSTGSATDVTSVYELSRFIRDQHKEKTPRPIDPSITLEAGAKSGHPDHTVRLSRPFQPEQTMIPLVQAKGNLGKRTSARDVLLILVALALSLVVLLWLTMWKK